MRPPSNRTSPSLLSHTQRRHGQARGLDQGEPALRPWPRLIAVQAEFENVDALEPAETTFWFTLSCSSCREVHKAPVAIDSTVRSHKTGLF